MESVHTSQKDLFQHILTTSSRLDATLNDLLEIIRLNHSSSAIEVICFYNLMAKIVETYSTQYDISTFEIKMDIDEIKDFKSDKVAI